jgi:hypothetical protein
MKNYAILLVFAAVLATGIKSFAGNGTGINEKLVLSFNKIFPQAENVIWQEFSDRYMVHFEEENIRALVNYDKDGNFLNSIRYYKAEILPPHILYKIIKKYPGKKIFGITEITNEEGIDYFIKMEDDANWFTVKSDPGGSFEIVEKYQKQP